MADDYVVPLVDQILQQPGRNSILTLLTKIDQISLELRTSLTFFEKVGNVVMAIQQSIQGIDMLLGEIPRANVDNTKSITATNDYTLSNILSVNIQTNDANPRKPSDNIVYLGSGNNEATFLKRKVEMLEKTKERLERELQQAIKELQVSVTQLAATERKRDEEAMNQLKVLRKHLVDARAVYLLKLAEAVGEIMRQLILPRFYLTGDIPPLVRSKSGLAEVFICLLELLQNEWEATVTALHTANSSIHSSFHLFSLSLTTKDDAWGKVLEVYVWWKGTSTLFHWLDGIHAQLAPSCALCKGMLFLLAFSPCHIHFLSLEYCGPASSGSRHRGRSRTSRRPPSPDTVPVRP